MKVKLNIYDLKVLQYILLNEQVDILNSVENNSFNCKLNDVSLYLSKLYNKVTLMRRELEKNG